MSKALKPSKEISPEASRVIDFIVSKVEKDDYAGLSRAMEGYKVPLLKEVATRRYGKKKSELPTTKSGLIYAIVSWEKANNSVSDWGDCNKCGQTRTVCPIDEVCEFCGCREPYEEYGE